MANITLDPNFWINHDKLDFSYLLYADSDSRGSSSFRTHYDNKYEYFVGSGFHYDQYGTPDGGTVTSYSAYISGTRAVIMTGVAIPVTALYQAASTYSTADDFALMASVLDGADTFSGGKGSDRFNTYGGRDRLYGGGGADWLDGGSGNDTFVFGSVKDSTSKSGDHIDLSSIDANTHRDGNQAFKFIGDHDFTGHAGELRVDHKRGDTHLYADVDGNGKADMAIHVDDLFAFAKSDFNL
ncbi:M10 family metallopeptidase C-terminal domain-containing protein [Rhizobium sp. LjRoot254]|uniref:M10 family metallopeptidase C-terminal domain-containing protein n=1 Tax=Rhizobium sp. LjRoot254 TaxID=3342297 RepID=UPI003ECEB696